MTVNTDAPTIFPLMEYIQYDINDAEVALMRTPRLTILLSLRPHLPSDRRSTSSCVC